MKKKDCNPLYDKGVHIYIQHEYTYAVQRRAFAIPLELRRDELLSLSQDTRVPWESSFSLI